MRSLFIVGAAALAACASDEEANLSSLDGDASETAQSPADNVAGGGAKTGASEPAVGGPNQWFERRNQREACAGYGPPFSEAMVSARCKGGRLIFSTTIVPASGPGSTTMQLSAAGVDENLPAESSEGGLPTTEATVAANAEWLTRLVSASGNLTIRVGDSDPLSVPIGEPLTSLIRDCSRLQR